MRWRKTEKIQTLLDSLLTSQDICQDFGITPMTLHEWRRSRGFPAVILKGKAQNVRFVPEDVDAWKKRNDEWLRTRSVFRPQPQRPADRKAA